MKTNNGQKQVSLAGVAAQKKKKPFAWKWVVFPVITVLVIVGLLYILGVFDSTDGRSLDAGDMIPQTQLAAKDGVTVTPDAMRADVAYYVVGVTGERSTDTLDMVAVLCYDRRANTLSAVQMPVATYVGADTGFAAKALGDVWGHPQPLTFCSSHRTLLSEEEIENNAHKGCGAAVETKKGSASGDLMRVFNVQYGLPAVNFVLIPREGLVELIDGLGGVDIRLAKKTTLDGTAYKAGVQTLSGRAAVTYATTYDYKKTPDSDRARMLRQRAVFAALLQRLAAKEPEDLFRLEDGATLGLFGDVMLGDNPVRFNSTSFGKARLLNISEQAAADVKATEAIARFAGLLSAVPLDKVTFSILPGESAKSGTTTVYSVNVAQTVQLLNEQLNPYGLTLDETTVTAPQLVLKAAKADCETAPLASVAVPQTDERDGEEE